MKLENRKNFRIRRHQRLRQKVQGTAARPRMAVFISNAHINVQFIDDDAGSTLASTTSMGMDAKLNVATAKVVGEKAAEAAKAKGISLVVVDRGGFRYHGRVKEVVEAALAAGLKLREEEEAV